MAGYSLLHDLTFTLRKRLFDALASAADDDFDLNDAASDILVQAPAAASADNGKVSLFLYFMGINGHMRNRPMVNVGTEALLKPPLPFQLKYLLTPVNDDHLTNQLMLGRMIQFLYDNPTLGPEASLPLDDKKGGTTELRIHPDNLSIDALNQIWTAMSEPYRLSYSFSVDVVTIDSNKTPVPARRVGGVSSGVGS
jgi:hypothetical protein